MHGQELFGCHGSRWLGFVTLAAACDIGCSALHVACWLDRADVVRALMGQWAHELQGWYDR